MHYKGNIKKADVKPLLESLQEGEILYVEYDSPVRELTTTAAMSVEADSTQGWRNYVVRFYYEDGSNNGFHRDTVDGAAMTVAKRVKAAGGAEIEVVDVDDEQIQILTKKF